MGGITGITGMPCLTSVLFLFCYRIISEATCSKMEQVEALSNSVELTWSVLHGESQRVTRRITTCYTEYGHAQFEHFILLSPYIQQYHPTSQNDLEL